MHQAQALVSCIPPGLVICCFTIDNIHAVLSRHPKFFILGYSPYTYCKRYKSLSHAQFFMTLQTVAHQVPLSKEFSRQDRRFWSGLPISSSRGSSWPGNQTPVSCIAGRLFTVWAIREWDANQCKRIHHILDIIILSDTDFFYYYKYLNWTEMQFIVFFSGQRERLQWRLWLEEPGKKMREDPSTFILKAQQWFILVWFLQSNCFLDACPLLFFSMENVIF